MNFAEIKAAVEELCDGRSLDNDRQKAWIKRIRTKVAMSWRTSGFRGLFFLYKEATVIDGSVAEQSRYAQPDDFIDDLNVYYDGDLLTKAPPGMLNIAHDLTATGTPKWFQLAGVEFEIIPVPDTAGIEIKLLYNGLPAIITAEGQEDYFMKHFPELHINGMAWLAAKSLGSKDYAREYKNDFNTEAGDLMLHNRRHYLKHARIRFQNWDEIEDAKNTLFPQLVESSS